MEVVNNLTYKHKTPINKGALGDVVIDGIWAYTVVVCNVDRCIN